MTKKHLHRFGLAALAVALLAVPVEAQQRYRGGGGGGFFDQLFGPGPQFPMEQQQQSAPAADYSRAPAPPRSTNTPSKVVVVMGDSMADWLAYGLEDAMSETPEVGVVRKHRTNSGLIRYEPRGDSDWAKVARETLSKERADFIVMMVGLNDRTSIRESAARSQPAKPAAAATPATPGAPADAAATEEKKPDNDEGDQISIIAPEPTGRGGGSSEFRTDRWAEIYGKKIDETIAALKSKGVPVFWVGLPAVRGTRSTSDVSYLNDLYRGRAEKAGITYIDVWDGFVDEGGRFAQSGPDFEGQNRRLRAYDGVHFTKAGARKLAHYVEREIQRAMTNRAIPVALPSDPTPGTQQSALPAGPAARPLAGAVVPLTGVGASEELLGSGPARSAPPATDPSAARVLVRGEPPPPAAGRADDFAWPRGQAAPTEALAPVPVAAEPAATARGRQAAAPANPKAQAQASAQRESNTRQRPQTAQQQPRPPQPVQQRPRSNDLFGIFR